jgi:hypothetical protein
MAAKSTTAGTPVKSCINNPRRHKGDFLFRLYFGVPVGQRLDVGLVDVMIIFLSEQILQQDFERHRQTRDVLEPGFVQLVEAKNVIALTLDFQDFASAETVHILLCHERSLSADNVGLIL